MTPGQCCGVHTAFDDDGGLLLNCSACLHSRFSSAIVWRGQLPSEMILLKYQGTAAARINSSFICFGAL